MIFLDHEPIASLSVPALPEDRPSVFRIPALCHASFHTDASQVTESPLVNASVRRAIFYCRFTQGKQRGVCVPVMTRTECPTHSSRSSCWQVPTCVCTDTLILTPFSICWSPSLSKKWQNPVILQGRKIRPFSNKMTVIKLSGIYLNFCGGHGEGFWPALPFICIPGSWYTTVQRSISFL